MRLIYRRRMIVPRRSQSRKCLHHVYVNNARFGVALARARLARCTCAKTQAARPSRVGDHSGLPRQRRHCWRARFRFRANVCPTSRSSSSTMDRRTRRSWRRRSRRSAPRIQFIVQPNRGAGAARNTGDPRRRAARLLAFLDADDRWLPEFLARQVALLESDRQCALVYCDALLSGDDAAGGPATASWRRRRPTAR